MLEALPSGGFRVREFAIADIWDVIEVRGVLEGTAARFAAERLSEPDELLRLRLCCRDAETLFLMSLENFVRYVDINDAFHAELTHLVCRSHMRLGRCGAAGCFISGNTPSVTVTRLT